MDMSFRNVANKGRPVEATIFLTVDMADRAIADQAEVAGVRMDVLRFSADILRLVGQEEIVDLFQLTQWHEGENK